MSFFYWTNLEELSTKRDFDVGLLEMTNINPDDPLIYLFKVK